MFHTIAKAMLPVPAPVIWVAFCLSVVFACRPVWSLFVWGYEMICGAF